MPVLDRNAALERRQIDDISANVTRRLLQVLEQVASVPSHVAAEIEPGARTITAIQAEIDRIVASHAPYELLDAEVLTHVLGSQQHALSILEHLEARVADARRVSAPPPDPARAHAALLAAARQIEEEEEARKLSEPDPWPLPTDVAAAGSWNAWTGATPIPGFLYPPPAHAPQASPPGPMPRATAAATKPRPAPQRPAKGSKKPFAARLAQISSSTRSVVIAAGLAGAIGLALAGLSLLPTDERRDHAAGTQTLAEHDLVEAPPQAAVRTEPDLSFAMGTPITPDAEQPYLVVLSTRSSPEELLQDFRGFKTTHAALLGEAKGRVDRVQGLDGKTWHRLSLIPPQAYSDARALCRNLRAAGLSGCWVRPLPLGRSP